MCEKQCRDEHGFKAHCSSESHNKNMIAFAQDPTKFMEKHSDEFHAEFMGLFSTRYRDKKVDANRVYQEVISNPEHVHLNSTKWMTLTGYVKHLGVSGLAKVEETETGFDIEYIDRSQATLDKLENQRKRALLERSEEERERRMLQDQVEKAKSAEESGAGLCNLQSSELIRESEKKPIKLQLKSLAPIKKEFTATKLSKLVKSGVTKKRNPL